MQVTVLDLEYQGDITTLWFCSVPTQQLQESLQMLEKHYCATAWCQCTQLAAAALLGPRMRWLWVPCAACSMQWLPCCWPVWTPHCHFLSQAWGKCRERKSPRVHQTAHCRGTLHWVVGHDIPGSSLHSSAEMWPS